MPSDYRTGRTLLRLSLFAVLLACGFCRTVHGDEARSAARPNVLVVITDDQGYGDFSFTGNPHVRTPHIDSLASEGVQFERFYVNSFCAPTRAALLTGRYPLRCGVWGVTHSKEMMRSEEVTLAEVLKKAGYRTACIGKWHNGEQYPYTPPGQGFDEFFGFHNGHINNYFDTELLRDTSVEKTKGYISDVLADEAIRFVSQSREQPFFCYLAFNAPHSPYQVPDRYYDKFAEKRLEPAAAAYYGMCENIDDNVGRLLAALDKQGLRRNTIVVFLTDNGGTAGTKIYNAGMRGGKTSVHEGGTRVPLLVRWPERFAEPRVVKPIAAHIDLFPTILQLCGVDPPRNRRLDGVSLVPLLEGKTDAWPERTLFTHNPISETNRYPGAVRTQKYRLVREIRGPGGGSKARPNDRSATPWQLYDMQSDPAEKHDLAAELPELVETLSRRYEAWYDDISSQELGRPPIPVGYDEENPVVLHAPQATLTGNLHFACGPGYAHDWLTGWTSTEATIRFEIDVVKEGRYEVRLQYGCSPIDAGSQVELIAGDETLRASIATAQAPLVPLPHRDELGHEKYRIRDWGWLDLGKLKLAAGRQTLELRAATVQAGEVMDFKGMLLRRLE